MATFFASISLPTTEKAEMLDITRRVRAEVKSSGIESGVCTVTSTHTTGGITINENTDPEVRTDILNALERAVPSDAPYFKQKDGNSYAHAKAVLTGFSVSLPVQKGKLVLGTWQAIYFCEFDGPRTRKLIVSVVG